MHKKSVSKVFLLSVIFLHLWLPTVYGSCVAGRRRQSKLQRPYKSRRQWKFPPPARRPRNVTTEAPFDPNKEDEENFTGTPPIDDQCTTQEKAFEETTTLLRVSFKEDCDYLVFYCMRSYDTGTLCARTIYFHYETFKNYCLMDYVNCMERYDMWQIVHMGKCYKITALKEYEHYSYKDDYFLDHMYVLE